MTKLFTVKAFDLYINDTNTYYSPPNLNAQLASAEELFVQVRATVVSGTAPKVGVTIEVSCTGQSGLAAGTATSDWALKSTPIVPTSVPPSGLLLFGTDPGGSTGAPFARLVVQLSNGISPAGNVEVWVTGRTRN